MFHVAIIVNENEVAHSAFADTLAILKRSIALGDQKHSTYRFTVFDKYNVHRLFQRDGEDCLTRFDSLIVATNATNNTEVLKSLRDNPDLLDEFLRSGRGVLICSQKKLSQRDGSQGMATGFLPDRYEYTLYDRPEFSSAAGSVTEAEPSDRVFSYPNRITNELIELRCSNNSFMPHKYRSHIVPRCPSQYLALLTDTQSPPVAEAWRITLDASRAVLLRSVSLAERLVVTSMALDWAGHEELLENILVYVTEGIGQIGVLRSTRHSSDKAMDAYVIRARVAKIPVREYVDISLSRIADLHHRTLIVSPAFTSTDVDDMWNVLSALDGKSTDLYHLTPDYSAGGFQLILRTKRSALDGVPAAAAAWLGRSFFPGYWGRSIWTYNYVFPMMLDLGLDPSPYLPFVFADLTLHVPSDVAAPASYDNVINASAQMLEILGTVFVRYPICTSENSRSPQELLSGCADWLVQKLLGSDVQSLRDRVYVLNSLWRLAGINALDARTRKAVCASAVETLCNYRTRTYGSCETVELTQVLELSSQLRAEGLLSETEYGADLEALLIALQERQMIDGAWRNISETAEVSLALLRLSRWHPPIATNPLLTEMVLRSAEFLLQEFDPRLGNWRNDVNATAKAAHALTLFDEQFGLFAGDLFAETQSKIAKQAESATLGEGFGHNGELLAALFRKEAELLENAAQAATSSSRIQRQETRLRHQRVLLFSAFVLTLIAICSLALLLGILFVKFPDTATKLLGNSPDMLIGGFFGLLLTLAFMGTYSYAKTTILDE